MVGPHPLQVWQGQAGRRTSWNWRGRSVSIEGRHLEPVKPAYWSQKFKTYLCTFPPVNKANR